MIVNLSNEQEQVLDSVIDQMNNARFELPQRFRTLFTTIIGGYAGTGKTTLLVHLRREIERSFPHISVAFVAFTGKASAVLKTKLEANRVNTTHDFIGTIHSLIYKAITRWDRQLKCYVICGWELKSDGDDIYNDIIIIDEGSMISKKIWDDLLELNKPIIVMGDHGQLPPIGDQFSLMENPHFTLTEIHRQALNSPIIQLSKFVRDHGYIPRNRKFSNEVFKMSWNDKRCKHIWNNNVIFDNKLIVLCAFNTTRNQLNQNIRKKLNYASDSKIPTPGERVVCLQNDRTRGIMNGQLGTMLWLMPESYDLYRMTIAVDESSDPIDCTVAKTCFGQVIYTQYDKSALQKKQMDYARKKEITPIDYFDFGYAMSVHKSQGSEWDKVILFEQRTKHWDDEYYARWLYTAITRAKHKLFIISDYWG